MSIAENLNSVLSQLPKEVTLVAVSKTKPNEDILEAYETGHRIFGENKVQELSAKAESLPEDIQWHMIGHLQSNKVKYIAPFVKLIHAVDSIKLLKEINKQAEKNNRTIDCLIQVHIAQEEHKFGFDANELKALFAEGSIGEFKNITIRGLMGMATFSDDESIVRNEFQDLKKLYEEIKLAHPSEGFDTLSMGMSGDYSIAIEEGSNMVRIGSTIFGARN